jgi:hypothetical protein
MPLPYPTQAAVCFNFISKGENVMNRFYWFVISALVLLMGVGGTLSSNAGAIAEAQRPRSAESKATSNPSGTWECWGDNPVNQCHNSLHRVVASSPGKAWAVGSSGTLIQYTNNEWTDIDSPFTANINGIDALADDDVWAVSPGNVLIGSPGGVLHWDGSDWSVIDDQVGMSRIDMLSTTDGWAVGGNGRIRHWNGSEWLAVDSPTTEDLSAISMASATHGWAAGWPNALIHWDGTEWITVTNPTANTISSISMISETDGWAVGNNGVILYWDGVDWSSVTSPVNSSLNDVYMLSGSEGWAVGGDFILQWDGVEWSLFSSSTEYSLIGVTAVSATEAYAVGRYGTILHWNGTEWAAPFASQHPDLLPTAVKLLSPTEGWMAGVGADAILRWDGVFWTPISLPGGSWATLYGLDALSDNDVWAVGHNGWAYHWNGTTWDGFGIAAPDTLNAVSMVTNDNAWAVGNSGYIVHWNGAAWNISQPTITNLQSVAMLSVTDGWAVGNGGIILHWDGNSWNEVDSPTVNNLNGISMISATDGWAVGNSGTVLRWNGVEWSTVSSPSSFSLRSVKMISAVEGWAVSGSGYILYWDGTNWSITDNPNGNILYDVDMLPSGTDGWAIGLTSFSGTGKPVLVRYTAPPVIATPELTINYSSGAPGSYFSVTGQNFPINETAQVAVNGHSLGTVQVDSNGGIFFMLTTTNADVGAYSVTASVNPSATEQFVLDSNEPVRPQAGTGDTFDVPAGIAGAEFIYLPLVVR